MQHEKLDNIKSIVTQTNDIFWRELTLSPNDDPCMHLIYIHPIPFSKRITLNHYVKKTTTTTNKSLIHPGFVWHTFNFCYSYTLQILNSIWLNFHTRLRHINNKVILMFGTRFPEQQFCWVHLYVFMRVYVTCRDT